MAAKGIYPAVSGAIAQSQRLDTISNNIANANTVGFKKDQQTFREYLTSLEKESDLIKVPKVPASIESFYDMKGLDQSLVDSSGTYTDFSQGGLIPTGNSLDIAIDGDGFFEVMSTEGIRLTRNGHFHLDGNGTLVTSEGHPVLSSDVNGADPSERMIRVQPGGGMVHIAEDGSVFQGEELLGQISVVEVGNKLALQKVGNSLFTFIENQKPNVENVENPKLRQGYLEGSNVNIVQEMTDLIQASRAFETNQKAIAAYDAIADKLVNQVPKT
jgi:flagellar basal-body rod protein FlgG